MAISQAKPTPQAKTLPRIGADERGLKKNLF
jgi:hypothetical protein